MVWKSELDRFVACIFRKLGLQLSRLNGDMEPGFELVFFFFYQVMILKVYEPAFTA